MNSKKRMMVKIRGVVSITLFVVFLVVTVTGIKMFLSQHEKGTLIHTYAGFLMIILVAVHLLLNYRMLLSELKSLVGRRG